MIDWVVIEDVRRWALVDVMPVVSWPIWNEATCASLTLVILQAGLLRGCVAWHEAWFGS